ncbi:hypothetical protein LZ198_05905 [Myxococcus sp. K15C18031901]|uniref:hypothetical protein n=1 Tax=Myxococcus dinghuensis TaxID=2906761 RepID=UPI0020A7F28B|nr:hypothetical protein [Myxococcus dinghuensis]MCP3098411.1 hypothetical protein [Myxococcus dinghuensis]
MHRERSRLAVLLLLLSGVSWAEEANEPPLPEPSSEFEVPDIAESDQPLTEDEDVPPVPSSWSSARWTSLLRVEAVTWALLPRGGEGTDAGFLQVEPTVVFERGEEFGINLGAPLRLPLWGPQDEGLFRREDWDSLSDWGQLVRSLKFGSDEAPWALWFGELDSYTMLTGHLVRRYAHRANPDYHPAAGVGTAYLGPVYVEAFSSDMLGARLMGAEVELDLEHVLFGRPKQGFRYTLSASVAHDWGRAGGRAPSVTLVHLDAVAVFMVRPTLEAHAFVGGGGKPGDSIAWGAVAGLGMESFTEKRSLWLRLEARRQHGGFRQGFFGADYELARFQAAGPDGGPVSNAPFPEGYSVFGEAEVGWDAVRYRGLKKHLKLSLGAEAFSWGRFDVDGRVAVQLFERALEVAVKGLAVGAGKPGARYLGSAEVRWRFLGGKLYAMGTGGTLLFPTAEGTLRPGAFASVGLGVDNAR